MTNEEKQALIDRCKTIAAWREKYGDSANVMIPAEEAEKLARIALTSLSAEPVGYVTKKCISLMERDRNNNDFKYHVISGAPYPAKSKITSPVALYTTTPPAPAIPDGWRLVKVEADEVLVALKRIEAYEDVDPQILAEDALNSPEIWPEWRVVGAAPEPGGDE